MLESDRFRKQKTWKSGNFNLFDIKKLKIGQQKNGEWCLLGFEVISSQFGVVNLEQDVGIANGGSSDLETRTTMGVSEN